MAFFDNIAGVFSKMTSLSFGLADFLDICLVAFIIYNVIKIIRETRAFQLTKGMLLLGAVYILTSLLEMEASKYIFNQVFGNVILVLIILFHPEIRHAIEHMGRSRVANFSIFGFKDEKIKHDAVVKQAIIEVAKACMRMSDKRIGSLTVMEKSTLLGDVIKTGTTVDALVTHELMGNIFFPNSPLHDGAAVIREGRLLCAGCVLPLTDNNDISSDIGMRHRAALGMSEQSDAMIVVTSEETGTVSVAHAGTLERGLTEAQLREKLIRYLIDTDKQDDNGDGKIKKLFKGLKKNEKN